MKKLDLYKFVGRKNDLRPALSGVYYKDGLAYSTDAHAAVVVKDNYPKNYEGKIIRKDGSIVNAKPLNFSVIWPKGVKQYIKLNIDTLKKISSSFDRNDMKDGEWARVYIAQGKKGLVSLSAPILKKLSYFAECSGGDTLEIYDMNKAVVMRTHIGDGLFMPLLPDNIDGEYISFKDFEGESHNGADIKRFWYDITTGEVLSKNGWREGPGKVFIASTRKEPVKTPAQVKYPVVKKEPVKTIKANKEKKKMAPITTPTKAIKIENKPIKPTNMKKKTRTTTRTKRAASTTINRAAKILKDQKSEYQRIFKFEIRKGGDSKKAAVRAGSTYRSRFGATPSARWRRALRAAQN